jgi:hypothetical protein
MPALSETGTLLLSSLPTPLFVGSVGLACVRDASFIFGPLSVLAQAARTGMVTSARAMVNLDWLRIDRKLEGER